MMNRLSWAAVTAGLLLGTGPAAADFVFRQQSPVIFKAGAPSVPETPPGVEVPAEPEFVEVLRWEFDGSADGWEIYGYDAYTQPTFLQVQATEWDPKMRSPRVALDGDEANVVRMHVRRTLAGNWWHGGIFYRTRIHDEGEPWQNNIPNTTRVGEWVTLEWDMRNPTYGGDDWVNSTIFDFRIDLSQDEVSAFDIDWISVGRYEEGEQ
jgi:hypothetical protein